jgi:hypothetical protein
MARCGQDHVVGDHAVVVPAEQVCHTYLAKLQVYGVCYVLPARAARTCPGATETLGTTSGANRLVLDGGVRTERLSNTT